MAHTSFRAVMLFGVGLGVAVSGASCRQPGAAPVANSPAPRPAQPTTQPMGKHWVQDQRLRAVMTDVSRQMRQNYPNHLPQDPEQPVPPELNRTLADASKLADELAKASERIPHAIEGNTTINSADRAGFLEEARTLRQHALDLSAAASERRVEAMQRSLLGINATCIACHSKYKDISGEIALPRQARGREISEPTRTIE